MLNSLTNIYVDGSTNNHYRYGTKHIFLGLTKENVDEIRAMNPRIHKSITIALTDSKMPDDRIDDVIDIVKNLRNDYRQTMQLTIVVPKRYRGIRKLKHINELADKAPGWLNIVICNELRQYCSGLRLPGCDMIIQYKVKHLSPRYVTLSEVNGESIVEVATVVINDKK